EAEHGYEEEEVQGRCAAILSNGRRCPNAALPGSRYCGLELHQALAEIDGDNVVDLVPGDDAAAGAADAEAAAEVLAREEAAPEGTADAEPAVNTEADGNTLAPQQAAAEPLVPEGAPPQGDPEVEAPAQPADAGVAEEASAARDGVAAPDAGGEGP